jgi:hypothetical protein
LFGKGVFHPLGVGVNLRPAEDLVEDAEFVFLS